MSDSCWYKALFHPPSERPTLGINQNLCQASNGLFIRNLGWKLSHSGSYTQHKFYLGRDEAKAKLASLRLEQLWEQACKRWQRENPFEPYPTDRPVWNPVTLAIAEAIRNAATVARTPLPLPFSAMIPESPMIGDWLDQLQKDFPVIKIEVHDAKVQEHSENFLQKQGQRLVEMGRRMLHKKAGGETLHVAFDAYSRWISAKYVEVQRKPTAWSGTQSRQIAFVRRHLSDCALTELDAQRIEESIDILRLRPVGLDGQPVSVSWTQNCVKQFRRFLRWLNKSVEFA